MTLVINEIHGMGPTLQPLVIAAADRRITKLDGSYHSTRRKLFKVPSIAGAVSYFGLSVFSQGGKQVFLSDWLPTFIQRSRAVSVAAFARELQRSLSGVVPGSVLRTQPSGLHVCGFDAEGRPDFWYVTNVGAMRGFAYEDLRSSYLEATSHFLGGDLTGFGLDPVTGRAPRGHVQIFRNGDIRVHVLASEAIDKALRALQQFPDFKVPRTPSEYGAYVRFKFEVIAYVYKKWARRQIVARPIDVLVLEAPRRAV